MNAQITTAAEEQQVVADSISRNVVAELSKEAGQNANHLTPLSTDLDKLVQKFKA